MLYLHKDPRGVMKRIALYTVSLIFLLISILFPLPPISDFGQYWEASGDLTQYVKGGVLVLLYAPFYHIGFPPFIAALLINLSAFFLLSSVFPTGKLSSIILLFIGLSLSPWAPIVNSDIPSVALLAAGMIVLFRSNYCLSFFILTAGMSIRMQSIAIGIVVFGIGLLLSIRKSNLRKSIVVLVFSMLLGFSINQILQIPSVQIIEIAKSSRVPIYAGFLATEPGPKCGEITTESKEAMLAQMDQSVIEVFRFQPNPIDLFFCKWKKMVLYDSSGAFWLGNYRTDSIWSVANTIESTAIWILKLSCIAFLALTQNRTKHYWLALIIFFSYLGLHTIFEIQPRYMIPAIILPILLCVTVDPISNKPKDI